MTKNINKKNTVRYFSITGFYPDDKKDDSLQFETRIKNAEQHEALAQITEAKPFNAVEPGEPQITEEQLKKIEKTPNMKFPADWNISSRLAPTNPQQKPDQ
ncbi:pyocin S6 family toxin immunity protein [Pseudomonas sp. Q11]|uniref:pyocin S6 family toxin immunity protein n=1 Tax=Pseudomonas sp. Q11 TaxID=2968470 RepID=UPI0021088EB7|nr:pyocin S6 family toxin immunity protein [Pseudomonas sp. Q11]MCQ6257379.1 pyocin S6 family toxin immunity protein [Pseudomonas sp. Q11]